MKKLKEILKGELSERELKLVRASFDIIGSREKAVATVEIPEELEEKKFLIANAIVECNKNVKSVLRKLTERRGKLRLRKFELLAGDLNTEVLHKEYGRILKLDPQKVYFSPREATERQRMASRVKAKDKVLVVGSGVAPLPIAITKHQPTVEKIYGIEINETAHKYALENIRINKVSDKIVLIKGDIKEELPRLNEKFNRVFIPIVVDVPEFLELVMLYLSKKATIHFYFIGSEPNPFSAAISLIKKIAKKFKKKLKIVSKAAVLPYGPRKWKIRIDSYLY